MSANRLNAKEALRLELREHSVSLLAGGSVLGNALREVLPDPECAIVLQWVPEQAEDIYWILVGPDDIAIVEIPRNSNSEPACPLIQRTTVERYRERRLSKVTREKLELALGMI